MKINRLKTTSRKHEKDAKGRLDDLFDEQIAKEFVDRDVNTTMATMVPEAYEYRKDQVVDELIVSFTHDTKWDYVVPGLPPTGTRVELPHVVVMKFENREVAHEHICWDQASLLVQVGVLDPANLPVRGVEQPENCCTSHNHRDSFRQRNRTID